MPIARRHTHRERGCRVRVRCGAGGETSNTRPTLKPRTTQQHSSRSSGQERRSRQQRTARVRMLGARKCGGAVGTNRGARRQTQFDYNTKHKPRTAYQAHDARIRLVLDSRSAPPVSSCGAIAQSRSRRLTKGRRGGASKHERRAQFSFSHPTRPC